MKNASVQRFKSQNFNSKSLISPPNDCLDEGEGGSRL